MIFTSKLNLKMREEKKFIHRNERLISDVPMKYDITYLENSEKYSSSVS